MPGKSEGTWVRLAGLLTLLMLIAPGTAASQTPAGSPVPFVTIAAADISHMHEPGQLVIRDQAGWADLWRRVAGPGGPPPPPVDFHRDMLIGVFAGQISEPATVAISRIMRTSDRLVIWYAVKHTRPPLDGGGTFSSAPFHIVRLARSPLPVEFFQVKTPQVLRSPP